MLYDFDSVIDRRNSDSTKWNYYPEDVLPLWTADMDFRVAEPVVEALHGRVDHGIFGYARESRELREVIAARMARLYGWKIAPESVVFQPGVVVGFNRVCSISGTKGDGVLVQPPVYPPILAAPRQNGMELQQNEVVRAAGGRYEIDFDAFEAAITERTRLFIFCNPHNPVGRAFGPDELERIAEICLRRNVLICSDEIHCDIVYRDVRHIPIASISPEVGAHTVTLMAPSKTYNIPGLQCSFAIVTDPALRRRLQKSDPGHFPEVNTLGFTAALAAFQYGDEWLSQVLEYLQANRDLVSDFVARELCGMEMFRPEATYLAWLRCGGRVPGNPHAFFLEKARVGLSGGSAFGRGGEDFVRLNFATPRSLLLGALERMRVAWSQLEPHSQAGSD